MKKAIRKLGVTDLNFTSHCFRHGGATFDVSRGKDLKDVLARGRWAQANSAKRYIQTGQAMLLRQKLPEQVKKRGDKLQQHPNLLMEYFSK